MTKKITAAILLAAAAISAVCFYQWRQPVEKNGFLMDTSVRIVLYDGPERRQTLEEAFALLRELDTLMNVHREDSELSRLNQSGAMKVSPHLFTVIERGLYFSQLSHGVFDITIRPLTELWDFKQEQIPSQEAVWEALQQVDYRNVLLSPDSLVTLKNGATLDLGGIAKGYAADCVCTLLGERGIKNALIDIGGNIKVLGDKSKQFTIGLQDPYGQRGSCFATLSVCNQSVVSSGIYERNFEKDGQIYHHIIDPRTGMPLQNGIIASSVLTESAMDADALSTLFMLLGKQEGIRLADTLPRVECVLVDQNRQLSLSSSMALQITNDTYERSYIYD